MAENKVNNTEELNEELGAEVDFDDILDLEDEVDEKKPLTVPKWLVTFGKVAEGTLAIFGGVVAVFWIKDKTSKKRRRNQIPARHESRRILEDSGVTADLGDVKITNF